MRSEWRNAVYLLASLSLGNLGNFIYLVCINILVFNKTGSATAVAALWLIGPLTNIVMKYWTGSYIDFRSKRKIMIQTYIARGSLIILIPLMPQIVFIYIILILLSMANAFFGPSSMTYITLTIPKDMRKRFNSIKSFTSSSAFMIGPAIGGSLIILLDLQTTLLINGGFFILAALLLMRIADTENLDLTSVPKLTLKQVKDDFGVVNHFMKQNLYVSAIYLGFIFVMVATFAMDAQEVVFTQQVIGLSEMEYSLLISITGIGSVAGGVILSILSHCFTLRFMISVGILLSSIGYVIYALSWSFISITAGFMVLGFFLVFLNAGISTFYQNNVQTNIMGRVTSVIQLVQSLAQVLLVLLVGFLGDILSLRVTIIGLSLSMLILSFIFVYFVNETKYNYLYKDTA